MYKLKVTASAPPHYTKDVDLPESKATTLASYLAQMLGDLQQAYTMIEKANMTGLAIEKVLNPNLVCFEIELTKF